MVNGRLLEGAVCLCPKPRFDDRGEGMWQARYVFAGALAIRCAAIPLFFHRVRRRFGGCNQQRLETIWQKTVERVKTSQIAEHVCSSCNEWRIFQHRTSR